MNAKSSLLLILFGSTFQLGAKPDVKTPPGYQLEQITPPENVRFSPTGIDIAPDGNVCVTTREGDVWMRKPGENGSWSRFASGLQNPLGAIIDSKPGHVFVSQRTELTELIDENNDGTADMYRRVNGGWGFTGNYHEFTHGPVRDSKGNFYVALNLAHAPGGIQGSIMARTSQYRGWVMQITPDGKLLPFASGFRSPVGITMSPKDELFVMDSQGDWMPTSPLFYVEKDKFHYHPSSLADHPDFEGKDLNSIPVSELEKIRTEPAIWIPYGELANCPGQAVFDTTGGKFGHFANQIFFGDQTRSNVMRSVIEKVDGEYQGVVFNFAEGLESGFIRGAFAPDGSFWMVEIDHGWGSVGGEPAALERLVWDGETVPFEMENIEVTSKGFKVTFTKPVDAAAAGITTAYDISHWHYLYQGDYGSPKVDEKAVAPSRVTVSSNGLTADIELPLVKGQVYKIKLNGINSASGEPLSNTIGWYTLNRLPK